MNVMYSVVGKAVLLTWLRRAAVMGLSMAVPIQSGCTYPATPAELAPEMSSVPAALTDSAASSPTKSAMKQPSASKPIGTFAYTFDPLAPKLGTRFADYPPPIMGTTYLGTPGENNPQFKDLARIMRDDAFFQWDLDWARTEKSSGNYDWSALDARVADARDHDDNLLVTLRGWHPAHGGVQHDVGPWLDEFVRFAQAAATHVRQNDNVQFEIWSAPDAPSTRLMPSAFAQMVLRVSTAIKAISPKAQVFSGAATSLDPAWRHAVLAEFATQGVPKIDGFGVDPGDTGTPEQADAPLLAAKAEVQSALGPNIPIVVSHWAFPSDNRTDEHAASFLARQWLALWRIGISRGLLYPSQGNGISLYGSDGREEWSLTRAQEVFSLYAGGDGAVLAGELAGVPGGWRIAWKRTCFIDTFFVWNPNFDARPLTISVPVGSVYINHQDRASVKTITRVELNYDEEDGNYVFVIPNDNTPTVVVSSNKGGCSKS